MPKTTNATKINIGYVENLGISFSLPMPITNGGLAIPILIYTIITMLEIFPKPPLRLMDHQPLFLNPLMLVQQATQPI
jgi:hypothetical protein